MPGSSRETQTTTIQPPRQVTDFYNRFVAPNFGQPGFSTPQIPSGFPIGAGPDPFSQVGQQGLLQFLSGPFQQIFGGLQGQGNFATGTGQGLIGQGAGGIQGAQLLAALGLNPSFNPVAEFNLGLSGEASDAFSRILSGNPFGPGRGNTINVGGGGGFSSSQFQGQGAGGGGGPSQVDAQDVIDQTTIALTDNFFERVLPNVTSRLIGSGNLGSSRGEILTANSIEDFNAELARQVAAISLGVSEGNANRAAALAQSAMSAGASVSSARIGANAAQQNAALQAMLSAAGSVQGGIQAGFSPFFNQAVGAGLGGGQSLLGAGSGLFGQGTGIGQGLLGAPLPGLQLLNAFGFQNTGQMDSIIQRLLPIFMSNQTTGLQDLQNFSPIINQLFGGAGTNTQTGPGTSPLGTALGLLSLGTGLSGLFNPPSQATSKGS